MADRDPYAPDYQRFKVSADLIAAEVAKGLQQKGAPEFLKAKAAFEQQTGALLAFESQYKNNKTVPFSEPEEAKALPRIVLGEGAKASMVYVDTKEIAEKHAKLREQKFANAKAYEVAIEGALSDQQRKRISNWANQMNIPSGMMYFGNMIAEKLPKEAPSVTPASLGKIVPLNVELPVKSEQAPAKKAATR